MHKDDLLEHHATVKPGRGPRDNKGKRPSHTGKSTASGVARNWNTGQRDTLRSFVPTSAECIMSERKSGMLRFALTPRGLAIESHQGTLAFPLRWPHTQSPLTVLLRNASNHETSWVCLDREAPIPSSQTCPFGGMLQEYFRDAFWAPTGAETPKDQRQGLV